MKIFRGNFKFQFDLFHKYRIKSMLIFIFNTDLCSYYFSDVGREHCIVIDVVETASKAQGTILYCLVN